MEDVLLLLVLNNGLIIIWGITGNINNSYNVITLPISLKLKIFSISALVYDISESVLWNEFGIA